MSKETTTFDITNVFSEEATSAGLPAGIHPNVRLISVDPKKRKDYNGEIIKKQLFLKFKKFNKNNEDIGEKEISFFLIDPTMDSAIGNLRSFISQVKEVLSIYYTDEELDESFNPLKVLITDDMSDEDVEEFFKYDNIKSKVLKKMSLYSKVQDAIIEQFYGLMKDNIGFKSSLFRLKLEESKDAKYVQIPRFERFVEKMSVEKKNSLLYNS